MAKGRISFHTTILLNGEPVGLMFSDDCEEPFGTLIVAARVETVLFDGFA